VHALLVSESLANRYRVRPSLSARILPRLLLFSTPTVTGPLLSAFGGAAELVVWFRRRRRRPSMP
jgi:hypothetical protein